MTSVGEAVEGLEPHALTGTKTRAAALEDSRAASRKVRRRVTDEPVILHPGQVSKGSESIQARTFKKKKKKQHYS